MPTVLTPVRIVRARRTSFQATEETQEIDFDLGINGGLRVHAVEFGIRQAILVPGNDAVLTAQAHLSLHIETGALEGAIDAFPTDNFNLNSEIMAETTLQVSGFTSSVPATSSENQINFWQQPNSWNFHDLLGGPIDLAQNLTFRGVTSAAALTVNGAQVTIFYQYIRLTDAELGAQFALRR